MYKPRPVSCRYGAPMGRDNILPLEGKVHLQLVKMVDCNAYDSGGAYWGSGTPLYCAYNDEGEVYLRATSRKEAKKKLRARYSVTFYR